MIKPENEKDVSDAVISILKDKENLVQMGLNARKYASKYFDIENVSRWYRDLILGLS